MAANSALRRAVKRILAPVLNETTYSYIQSLSMARDLRSGVFTEPEIDLIRYAVRPGETALDVGANYGMYSYPLSRAVGPHGRVWAFEPVPFTSKTLDRIIRRLGLCNVELVPKGCGDRAGTLTFTIPVQESGALMAGLAHVGARNDDRDGKESQVRWQRTKDVHCEVVAIDAYLPSISDLSLIKCDIEGAELFAFRGAERTIDRHLPTVICEINPWYLEGFGLETDDLVGFFSRKGYDLFFYEHGERRLRQIDSARDVVEDNYVFIHSDKRDRFAPLLSGAAAPSSECQQA